MEESSPSRTADVRLADILCFYDFRVPTDLHEYWWKRLREAVNTYGINDDELGLEIARIQAELESKGADLHPQWANAVVLELKAMSLLSTPDEISPQLIAMHWLIENNRTGRMLIGNKVRELENRINQIETNYPPPTPDGKFGTTLSGTADALCFYDWRVPTELHEHWWKRLREAVDTYGIGKLLMPEIERIQKELESAGAELANDWALDVVGELTARSVIYHTPMLTAPVMSYIIMLIEANQRGRWHAGNKIKELEDRIAALENSEEKTGKL